MSDRWFMRWLYFAVILFAINQVIQLLANIGRFIS